MTDKPRKPSDKAAHIIARIAERMMAATAIGSGPHATAQVAFRHAEALYAEALYAEGVRRGVYPEDVT